MNRQSLSIGLLITGLITGFIGNFFFYQQSPGLSVPLFVLILLIPILIWTSLNNKFPPFRKWWVIAPILFFALMFMLRANVILLILDGLSILALMALFLHYLNHEADIDTTGSSEHAVAILDTGITSMLATGQELGESWKWLSNRKWNNLSRVIAIGRGLLFAIPIIIIFAILLSSADAIFSERMTDFLDIFAVDNLETLAIRTLLVLGIAWVSAGMASYALKQVSVEVTQGEDEKEDDSSETLAKQAPHPFRLGITETTIILLSIVLLFGFFVMIQFAYFFAGEEAILEGVTYSDYARRGFFELLAVSALVLGLMLVLDHLTIRKNQAQQIIFLSLSVVKVVLTLVIMVSAWQRMVLYEQAYGFTYLRVYSHVFIVWVAVLLAIGLLNLFRLKPYLFATGLILVSIGYIATMNLMNVDYYIAERNIERYMDGEELDMCYLRDLSVDALPVILAVHNSTEDTVLRAHLARWLYNKQVEVAKRYVNISIFELNFAYRVAWGEQESMSLDIGMNQLPCILRN